MKFKARKGSGFSQEQATRYGACLLQIEEATDELTVDAVLAEAKKLRSPLHDAFEWDDTEAAKQHRNWQARRLIGSIEVVYETGSGKTRQDRLFQHVGTPGRRQQGRYVQIHTVSVDDDIRAEVIEKARAELASWRRRYSRYREFMEGAIKYVEDAEDELAA